LASPWESRERVVVCKPLEQRSGQFSSRRRRTEYWGQAVGPYGAPCRTAKASKRRAGAFFSARRPPPQGDGARVVMVAACFATTHALHSTVSRFLPTMGTSQARLAGDAKDQLQIMEGIVRTLMRLDAEQRQLSLFESRE